MQFETIIHALAYWADKTPDKVCLIEAETGRKATYSELWRWSCAFSQKLKDAGVRRDFDQFGSRVVVRVGSLLETVVAQVGICLTGGVFCPVERYMKGPKLFEMLKYYDSRVYVSAERIASDGIWFDLNCVIDNTDVNFDIIFPCSNELCAIIFTTGTTGKAKGVMLTHHSLLSACKIWIHSFQIDCTDVISYVMPLDRVGHIRWTSSGLLIGATVMHYAGGLIFSKDYYNAIRENHVNYVFFLVPELNMLLANIKKPRTTEIPNFVLTKILLGGGAVHTRAKKELVQLAPKARIFSHYGATEITGICGRNILEKTMLPNCVGQPCVGTEIKFVDTQGNSVPTSETAKGTLVCKNESVMAGYWKNQTLTQQYMQDGWMQMTDIGWRDENGYVYLAGRQDDVIQSGGFKIAPYEIEEIAIQNDGVAECVCIGVPDKTLGEVPKLFVQMNPHVKFNAKDIYNYISERIETYKLPRTVHEVDEFPRIGSSSKIDKEELTRCV
ncbi:MAG: acyl--CoA ligase [Desulfarculales bacterium]|jgi:long-chain acyl-CoA synthetase|nr:acyl--CoA ligase [Desulfarculales bacterium]